MTLISFKNNYSQTETKKTNATPTNIYDYIEHQIEKKTKTQKTKQQKHRTTATAQAKFHLGFAKGPLWNLYFLIKPAYL